MPPRAATGSPVHLAGLSLGDYRHVCAFFNSEDEEYRALLPFIEEGMQHGDRAVHVRSYAEMRDAERAARNAPGVTEVENRLTVDPTVYAGV